MGEKRDFHRNNLDRALSPYLRQHRENPVHWQEWSQDVQDRARRENRILFVSVGYATCHWCHVMAEEAFSDPGIAGFLNRHFISVKVDREQRPDIDRYLMQFLVSRTGRGGWPLNVFLTPDLKPVTAFTYLSTVPRFGMPGFLEVLKRVHDFTTRPGNPIPDFSFSLRSPDSFREEGFHRVLAAHFDPEHGGFGGDQKFPPHSTLLFLIHYHAETGENILDSMVRKTLDTIRIRGLHDHLQGGFFRYCVDRAWTIPHFEKMLYDQAMMLWVYSLAFAHLRDPRYRDTAEKTIRCLEETFRQDHLYVSGHDADTDHREGRTYTWSMEELEKTLTADELRRFREVYSVSDKGNFENRNHLVKQPGNREREIRKIEEKLLKARKRKPQPFTDRKIITSWNALTGIAFLLAGRYLEKDEYRKRAEEIYHGIRQVHLSKDRLAHSSLENRLEKSEFLEDYASMFLLVTYLQEETGKYRKDMEDWMKKAGRFRENDYWMESRNPDFMPVPADFFDHPAPSSVSLVEMARIRTTVLQEKEPAENPPFHPPVNHDFLNLSVMIRKGLFHCITTPEKIPWISMPLNTIQRIGKLFSDCYRGTCRRENPYRR